MEDMLHKKSGTIVMPENTLHQITNVSLESNNRVCVWGFLSVEMLETEARICVSIGASSFAEYLCIVSAFFTSLQNTNCLSLFELTVKHQKHS